MTSRVVLAHSPDVSAQAGAIAAQLAALGYDVSHAAGRRAFEGAQKVIVLWSRAARGTPALQAAVRTALARGKLVCVRLDSALPPVEAGGARAVRLPHGRAQGATWRKLLRSTRRPLARAQMLAPAPLLPPRAIRRQLAALPYPAPYAKRPSGALVRAAGVLIALALIVTAAGAEAYARDPDFAARVAALAGLAQARAIEFVAELAPAR